MSKVAGKVVFKSNVIKVNDKFQKQEIVIETNEQYPQKILLTATQEKVNLLEAYQVNDEVEASVNIKGREWINAEGVPKYFLTLEIWALTKGVKNNFANKPTIEKRSGIVENFEEEKFKQYEADNDLPF